VTDPTEDASDDSTDGVGEGADPHRDGSVVVAGAPAEATEVAVVLLHGRGATADGIVRLAEPLYRHGVTFYAPAADRSRWYPHSFLAPVERNEPYLSSALRRVEAVMGMATEVVPVERVVLGGFSQGACLAAEFAARHPRRYGGVFVLSGGLLGPSVRPSDYRGSLDGTSVFLGCGDADEHVPVERVHRTAETLRSLDGDVTERIYEDVGHEVTDDEFAFVGSLLDDLLAAK
jgi:phospholipase/carboxylesterase